MLEAAVQSEKQHEVVLPTGRLSVTVEHSDWPLARLCGFAARHNPKRGFLFVSKVLGKHWPTSPADMAAVHSALAQRLPAPSARPLLMLGMAETATGLGQGVFEAYLASHGQGSAVYLHTTRCLLSGVPTTAFEERHSHAQSLHLHWPEDPALRDAFLQAHHVILIDDELSTGHTFLSLIAAYRMVNPSLQQLSVLSLTDLMGSEARVAFRAKAGLDTVQFFSLLSGSYVFEPNLKFRADTPPAAQATVGCRRAQVGPCSARLGTGETLVLPAHQVEQLLSSLPCAQPVLVLGMGEFMHPAFCLARTIAAQGWSVQVQSTTRSPIFLGADIHSRMVLQDPYGEGIANYLYNVDPGAQTVVLCGETQPSAALSQTIARLGAHWVDLGPAR
jgi:hypothetical protein